MYGCNECTYKGKQVNKQINTYAHAHTYVHAENHNPSTECRNCQFAVTKLECQNTFSIIARLLSVLCLFDLLLKFFWSFFHLLCPHLFPSFNERKNKCEQQS